MKQVFLFLFAALLFACNSSDTKTAEEPKKEDAKVAGMSVNDLPYKVENWGDWQTGSMENAKMVMQSLKDYNDGKIDDCLKSFSDSIELRFDGMEGKFTKDSVRKMFTQDRSMTKAIEIKMEDFESVKSKDGEYEYVSLWYKQKWQDQKGTWDSIMCMDDLRVKDGKIASIDQKVRHYSKKKM